MGFRTLAKHAASRFVAGVFATMFLNSAWSTPAALTGDPIRAQVPGFQTPTTINLRELGVITGTAPINFTTRTIQFLINGQPSPLVDAFPTGAVCVTLVNRDFTARPGDSYALVVGIQNSQGAVTPTAIPFTNTAGPTVDPQSPGCADPNSPPTASAGGDRTIPDTDGASGELVSFAGSGSDAQGDRLTYQWFLNGATTPIATGPTASFRVPDGGSRVTLRVTDELRAFTNVTISISVTPPVTPPPSADAGPDQTLDDTDGISGESATLTGSATGLPTSLEWFNGSTSLGTSATVIARLPDGATVVTLRATYATGLQVTDTATITVTAPTPRQPPIANAGADRTIVDTNGQPGEPVTLDGSASRDPDGTLASFAWRDAAGTIISTAQNPSVTLPNGANVLTLTVTDNHGLASPPDTVQIMVNAPQRPTASAGTNRTIEDTDGEDGENVSLVGIADDPDGTVSSVEWRLGSASVGDARTLDLRLPNGANTLTFIVTDNVGLTAEATVVITVEPPPSAPTANAGEPQTIPDSDNENGESVTLTGSGSDADGTIVSLEWFLGDTRLGSGASLTTRIPDGAHTITLIVRDDAGLTGEDTVQITVSEPDTPEPQAPIANAGADRTVNDTDGQAGESVTLNGSGTDPDGRIVSYEWFLNSDASLGTDATLTTRLPDGTHEITLVVADDTQQSGRDTVQIVVGAPRVPSADAGADRTISDSDSEPGELVTLTGTATDSDGTIASYEWLLGSTSLGSGASVQARIPDGVNQITLRVRDNSGLAATDVVQITVTRDAQPPTANAGADISLADSDGLDGEVVNLSGSGNDPDGTIARYEWTTGDSSLGTGATLAVRLPNGVSAVTLHVTDDSGLTASDTLQVTVGAPVLPVVNAGEARSIADTDLQPGENVQLTGSATTQNGTISSYEWRLGDDVLGSGATVTARLPDGANVVTLRVTNSLNLVGTASVQITIGAPVRTVLAELPGLTANERRLAVKLDQACASVLEENTLVTQPVPNPERPPTGEKRRPPTAEESADFQQKCRGLVYSRDTAALVDAMGELLGDDFAVARTQTLLFANTQYASVMDRLIALRGGARGLSLAGLNVVVDGELVPLAELQDFAKMLLGGGASSDADNWGEKWGLWMRGNYSFGSKDEDELSPSFDADQYALLAGLDYRLSSNAVVGLALAYGDSSVEFNPLDEGGLDTESWAVSLYASVYAARNFYFDAILNVADASYEARRNITYVDGFGLVSEDAQGDTGGLTMSGGMSGGYDFLIGGLTVSPTLGVFYIDAQIDEFTESGARGLNLIYDEQRFKSLTGNLGLRATFAWNLSWGVLLPHVRADFVREFEDDVDVFGIRFAADPNAASTPPILVETENPDTSYWRFAGGFSAQFKYGLSGYVEYQRLAGFQAITFQDVSLGLRFQRSF